MTTATTATTVYTLAGAYTMVDPRVATIEAEGQASRGAIALVRDAEGVHLLVWEWGGDWTVFEDGQEHDPDQLDGWEPEAIRLAVLTAVVRHPECRADLAWFTAWADAAEATLSAGEDAEADAEEDAEDEDGFSAIRSEADPYLVVFVNWEQATAPVGYEYDEGPRQWTPYQTADLPGTDQAAAKMVNDWIGG